MAVNDLIQIRKGTASAWTSANPVLASGEPGYDLTNKIFKIGDGVSNWAGLASINLTSSNITDFGTATSGLLPVKSIVAGSNITISSSSGTYTINSTASGTGGGSSSTSVIEYGTVSNFPASGVGSIIYISTDTGRIYRWAGSVYQELGPVSYAPVGSDSRWNLLLPPTPTGVIAFPGNTQASVSWSASSATYVPPITDYSIQYSSDSGSTWSTYNHSASSGTSINVTGLVNNTSYIFRTAGINGVGLGSYSTASSIVYPVSLFVSDTFTGTNGTALSSRSPDSLTPAGSGWISHYGTASITNNTAYFSSFGTHGTFGTIGAASINSSASDCTITCQIKWGDNSFGYGVGYLLFRYQDSANFWIAGSDYVSSSCARWTVWEIANNVATRRIDSQSYGSCLGGLAGQTGQVQVILSGSTITAKFAANSTSAFTNTYTYNSATTALTATRHGIYLPYDNNNMGSAFANARFDNFTVTP
jgi:hypothetical protein